MTKPIATTGLMILVEEGKVRLDDPVSKYIPEFGGVKVWTPAGLVDPYRPVTVRDLLRHTSGLTYGFFGTSHVDSLYLKARPSEKATNLADLVSAAHGASAPGPAGHGLQLQLQHRRGGTRDRGGVGHDARPLPRDAGSSSPLKMPDTFFEVPAEKRARFTGTTRGRRSAGS